MNCNLDTDWCDRCSVESICCIEKLCDVCKEDTWTKYSYVCTDCDALMEITTRQDLDMWRPWCSCGSGNLTLIGYTDATVM